MLYFAHVYAIIIIYIFQALRRMLFTARQQRNAQSSRGKKTRGEKTRTSRSLATRKIRQTNRAVAGLSSSTHAKTPMEEEWLLYRDILDWVFHTFRAFGRPENSSDLIGRPDKSGLLVDITSTGLPLRYFGAHKSLAQRIITICQWISVLTSVYIQRKFFRSEKCPVDLRRSAWRIADIPSYVNVRREVIIPYSEHAPLIERCREIVYRWCGRWADNDLKITSLHCYRPRRAEFII